MTEFFHGWRRKVGCVLLVMACLLTGMWVRGRYYEEMIEIRIDNKSEFAIRLTESAIECEYRWETSQSGAFQDLSFSSWLSFRSKDHGNQDSLFPEISDSQWQMSLKSGGSAHGRGKGLMIPYSTSVLPLTLLSACLILWPRKRPARRPKAPPDGANSLS